MDLNNAIQKHAEWKLKFHSALTTNEVLDTATIAKDNCCEFGKWLHGISSTHGKFGSYAKCLSAHAAFHVEAGKVAAVINARKKEEAERMLAIGSTYSLASKKVGVAIIELKNEIGQ